MTRLLILAIAGTLGPYVMARPFAAIKEVRRERG
jgi:hypothetical protein